MEGRIYEYTALPMGLTCSPRIFTKLTKVVFLRCRAQGIVIIIYIDDILIIAQTYEECKRNVDRVVRMLNELGFVINLPKSCLEPDVKFLYLGLLWNTVEWTVKYFETKITF